MTGSRGAAHPDSEQLTLAALPSEPRDPVIEEHLAGCPACRKHVAALRHTVDLARTGHADTATMPPPRVWAAITAEVGAAGDAEPGTGSDIARVDLAAADLGPSEPVRTRRIPHAPLSRWRMAGVAIAAAVAGLAAGLIIGTVQSTDRPSTAPPGTLLARLQPIGDADPAASGAVDGTSRDGSQELVIRVDGITNTAGGDYLEAWLLDPADSRLVSLGALTRTPDGRAYQGKFTLPADLPMATFNTVDISAERWDGIPTHSGVSLLRGSMA